MSEKEVKKKIEKITIFPFWLAIYYGYLSKNSLGTQLTAIPAIADEKLFCWRIRALFLHFPCPERIFENPVAEYPPYL